MDENHPSDKNYQNRNTALISFALDNSSKSSGVNLKKKAVNNNFKQRYLSCHAQVLTVENVKEISSVHMTLM